MADGAVIITGASRGIGAALSIELDRRGFTVAGLSRTGDPPLGCQDPSRFLLRQCDATDEQQLRNDLEHMLNATIKRLQINRVDLVNNSCVVDVRFTINNMSTDSE